MFSVQHINMSNGDVRRSQSAKFFRSLKTAGEEANQRSGQLQQEEENTSVIVLVHNFYNN